MKRVALAFREEVLRHDTGPGHPESPGRIPAILDSLHEAGIALPCLEIAPAERKDLLRAHTEEHVDRIFETCAEGGWYPDPDTLVMSASLPAARYAAGAAISACRSVLEGEHDHVFSAMRPPGHHAEHHRAGGFCLFNNAAVAARWLQAEAGLKRVAIVDWDVHHGNGTEQITLEDDSIFYVSMHQHPLYPGTGSPDTRGKNNTNLNLQFAPGSNPESWPARLVSEVVPALEAFQPDFLIISAGFDAHRLDPLASQRLEARHYDALTRPLLSLANGRVASLLEGGYNVHALGVCAVSHIKAMQA